MKKTTIKSICIVITLVAAICGTTARTHTDAYAATAKWIRSGSNWWYQHADGSYTTNGWEKIGGQWYFFDRDGWMKTGWVRDGGKWYYLDANGAMKTGWQKDGGKWYYLDANGAMKTGWQKVKQRWYYLGANGAMRTGWLKDGGKWYYLRSDGLMASGWQKADGSWYYMKKNGTMTTDWQYVGGQWYYMYPSGAMKKGWLRSGEDWYYMEDSGQMAAGWKNVDGSWYYFDKYGNMETDQWIGSSYVGADGRWIEDRTGDRISDWQYDSNGWWYQDADGSYPANMWRQIGGEWYCFGSNGYMMTGWQQIVGKWYCFDSSGAMMTGWQQINGKWYYLDASGIMPESTDTMIEDILGELSLEEKVAQLFIITPEGLTGTDTVTEAGSQMQSSMEQYPVGGVIFMGKNLVSPSQTKSLLQNTMAYSREVTGLPAFLAVDEEGGTVARIASNSAFGIKNVGNMREIGSTKDPKNAYQVGKTIGSYLYDLGFNVDFAPVADVLTNTETDLMLKRSFGSDPAMVSAMVQQEILGLREEKILSCSKHFPGHGATGTDTHNERAIVSKSWEELRQAELIPFIDSIKIQVPMIMVGQFSLPEVTGDDTPCSLSEPVIGQKLRGELDYNGIVLTDALNMGAVSNYYSSDEAAIQALQAEADIILMPYDFRKAYHGVLSAVRSGKIPERRIDESLERILRVKLSMPEQ